MWKLCDFFVFDHPRSCVVYNVGRVCMSVCLSDDNSRKPQRRKFIFAHAPYLHSLRVKFVYEGHRVKVKVTGAKKVQNSYSHNVKLRWAITSVLSDRAVMFACCMGFSVRRIEWYDGHLCYVTESEHTSLNASGPAIWSVREVNAKRP